MKNILKKIFTYIFHNPKPIETEDDFELNRKRLVLRSKLAFFFDSQKDEIVEVIVGTIKQFFLRRWPYLLWKTFKWGVFIVAIYMSVILYFEPRVKTIYSRETQTITKYKVDSIMTLDNFLMQIQYRESRYDSSANRKNSEYWGLYQLGNDARKIAGYEWVPKEKFLQDPEIQYSCMLKFMRYNKKILKKYIDKYSGKVIGGIPISESGIIAGAHLGSQKVIDFLESGGKIIGGDANNTPVTDYLRIAGYKLNI